MSKTEKSKIDSEIRKLFEKEPDFETDTALSAKTKTMIIMAIDAVMGKEGARGGTLIWAQNAMKHGATKEEITEALHVAQHMGGRVTMLISLDVLREILTSKE